MRTKTNRIGCRVHKGGQIWRTGKIPITSENCECGFRANVELALFEIKHPRAVKLKPIMLEIAENGWPLVDYTKPYQEIFAQLFYHAKKIQKERERGCKRS